MTMEPQISLNCEGTSSSSINLVSKDVNSGLITSLQDLTTSQPPVKKQPRQWAAWTRQEEESFFMALRQVGKNFEKITSRVQSKNKDQVRHYYYRLVRRMNKLLGPELCLDARNCKVTNAAMLRWWSLLEKYSCKASKLHLKPRRYKLFIETLENQLLRDRRKNIKKQPSQGDTSSTSPSQAVKEVKIQKSGNGKGSSTKNIGINHANCKPTRLRKKKGSTVAYRKWEKAAIAGVSLVAEAAEQLERTNINKEGPLFTEHAKEDVNPSLFNECSGKLKLQLFPIDESTRKALEMDNHNPHLELTLSTRKKISSVMEHLYKKWGNSSIANGELMLFPYTTHKENLVGSLKWSKECNINASDVFTLVGSPPIFRLRYGWFPMKEQNVSMGSNVNNVESFITQVNTLEDLRTHKGNTSTNEWADSLTNISIGDLLNEDPNCIINSNSPILNTCSENLHQIPFSCDSFDAAIAAHINNHQIKPITCNESSIWDAEETCDGFSFHKNIPSSTSKPQEINEAHKPLNECSYVEDLNGLTDIYWPESLGGLDMDIASSKYHSEDLILNDSLGGLNRLIANSLDAFQNCSFFGLDKKESGASKLEAQETISFVDCEIGTKV